MPAYAPASATSISNQALQLIGGQAIQDIDDKTSPSARECAKAFWQAVREVGREHNWNCLKKRAYLSQLTIQQIGSPAYADGCGSGIGWIGAGVPKVPPPYWLAHTPYQGSNLVTYGMAAYYCLQAHTSSANFINDLTAGLWAEIYMPFSYQQQGPAQPMYEWQYGYALPVDYLLLSELNGTDCCHGKGIGRLYELFVSATQNGDGTISNAMALFTNAAYADIKYTALIQDTTIWDPLFTRCVIQLLAAKIATVLRGDGRVTARELLQEFTLMLSDSILKDSNEGKLRRYDPTKESNFLRSRYNSTAG